MKDFKPFLAPNKSVNLDAIKYPIFSSHKLDGIRCIFHPELGMVSRSLKKIQNPKIQKKFFQLSKFSRENKCFLDGELYCHRMTFQEITSIVMTKNNPPDVPNDFKFHMFDMITPFAYSMENSFLSRLKVLYGISNNYEDLIHMVEQETLNDKRAVENMFNRVLDEGYEGLILKEINGRYKFGRGTIKEGLIYKVKPWKTFDATILDVIQATVVDPNAEKKINELGRSVTSKKKDDRILIPMASAFLCEYNDNPIKPVIAMTDNEKAEIWRNRHNYIGRNIEYKAMMIGAKDVPRHPVMKRFRTDKD